MTLQINHIDNAIELRIRSVLVASGNSVDPEPYLPSDTAGYDAAIGALSNYIELIGMSPPKGRKEATGTRIVVYRTLVSPGDVGFQRKYFFKEIFVDDVLDHYEKYKISSGLYDIEYEIRFVADSTLMDRACSQAIVQAFSSRKFLYGVNDDLTLSEEGFYVISLGDAVDLSKGDLMEKFYRFRAKDVDIELMELVDGNIKLIDEIEIITGDNDGFDYDSITENIS